MEATQLLPSPIVVNLHGLVLAFWASHRNVGERFETIYGHLPRAKVKEAGVFIRWHLVDLPEAPLPPENSPVIAPGPLVSYYGRGRRIFIRMPKYALVTVDLRQNELAAQITRNCLDVYGAFEDVLMIALAPLYRRKGWFPLHAFAGLSPEGQAVLISGQMGSGKTTTGLALLNAGWKLLSNDSPLLALRNNRVDVLAYPGRLSAFDDTLAWFDRLKRFIPREAAPGQKRVFRAEEAFDAPWALTGPALAVFFPQVTPGLSRSELVEVAPKDALLALMPQGVEGWDREMVGPTMQVLNRLVEQARCYRLRLSPHVHRLPGLIAAALSGPEPVRPPG